MKTPRSKKDTPNGRPRLEPGKISGNGFPIVGLGASAGGLLAFEKFFTHLPTGTEHELAFILIQHLDPDHKSLLVDLVQRYTKAQVSTAEDGVKVQAGHAYVIPPGWDLAISKGKLQLTQPANSHKVRLPIDFFFRSLAQDQHERAVGIILSGTGTDGTQGLKSIKEAGGLVMAQTPESADFDGMPRSALATRLVDYVLAPEEMPERLLAYSRVVPRSHVQPDPEADLVREAAGDGASNELEDIFRLLRTQTGHDFSGYKRGMTIRRLERRLLVHMLPDFSAYLALLQNNTYEVSALLNDLLIGVTSFFRNPGAFEVLKERVISPLILNSSPVESIRVWVPGCSTGEEAYSLAILFRECMEQYRLEKKVQIFATDIDTEAIAKARGGVYLENIALDVSAERLGKYFTRGEGTFTIRKSLREMVVFADHNLTENPPFSRLSIISCRNLLIYLGTRLQKRIIPLFHYALLPDGHLFLGSAEGVGPFGDLFSTMDRKWKLFSKKDSSARSSRLLGFSEPAAVRSAAPSPATEPGKSLKTGAREHVERFLLNEYAPACVVINEKLEVVYIHGHTGSYLEPAQGEVSSNLLRMARPGLRLELAAMLRKSARDKTPTRVSGLRYDNGNQPYTVNLAIYPVEKPEALRGLLLVVFQDAAQTSHLVEQSTNEDGPVGLQSHFDQETLEKDEYFHAIIEELEAANEELKSNNEEMQATNEEMQSANEELETAHEEMRSVNEELNTVNTELTSKMEELYQVSNDMKNLLAATGIATLFLDTHLNILRYTPATTRIINLIPGDLGRPVSDIVTTLEYTNLVQDAQDVLDTLAHHEVETRSKSGAWYLIRIRPYRTTENVIEGVVVTFVDISEQKMIQAELQTLARQVQEEREFAESILATVSEPLVALNEKREVVFANPAYYRFFQTSPAETVGVSFFDASQRKWDLPELSKLVEEIELGNKSIEGFELDKSIQHVGKHGFVINARKVMRSAEKEHLILLAFKEIL